MFKKDFWIISLWVIVYEAIGFLLGILTKNNLYPWYDGLIKSDLTPPSVTFSIVWTLLYGILAVIGWYLWNQKTINFNKINRVNWCLYVIQMLMNWLWTPLFFTYHLVFFSLIWISVLSFINLILGFRLINKDILVGLLFIPYVFWLFYATYLNAVIYWFN